jgi:kumamolisin
MCGGPGWLRGWCGGTGRGVPEDRRRPVRIGAGRMTALCVIVLLALNAFATVASAQPGRRQIPRDTPIPVVRGQASFRAHQNPNSILKLNVGLDVRNSAQLDALITAASTPGSPGYGHYLTRAQYRANYAPTPASVTAVKQWLASQGLGVAGVSPDNLLVHVRGRTAAVQHAFGVTINQYKAGGREFHANNRNPAVPTDLHVQFVSGLSNYDVIKAAVTCTPNPGSECGYDGGDFRSAYDISGDGSGQTVGFTLWGQALPQSDFTGYAGATGTTPITVGQTGDDGLDYIPVDGSSTESDTDNEVALDTEVAHGVAPGIHETYWLGHDNSWATMEDVVNQAANSNVAVISNSWGAQSSGCPADPNMETSLQQGAATGKTFYFASGDGDASGGCEYPAVSQYAVAVGGTSLIVGADGAWSSETAMPDGGGCSDSEPRPAWQTGIGTPLAYPSAACTGRADPDVSADSGIGTYLYFDGAASCCSGGTSLATPIWAAASAVWNESNANSGRPGIGFSAPLIYSLANDPTDYANDFHDITSGSNGFAATTGWDEVTGWGSPDFNQLSNNQADISLTEPSAASSGDTVTLSATLTDHGTTDGLGGRTISFTVAGDETCTGTTDAAGSASCPVTISDPPGHYSVSATFGGDGGYGAASTSSPFTVLHIPTTLTYTGATSGGDNSPVTLSAQLTENSDSTAGVPSETINFSLGAESCTATTDPSGDASCSVTPVDDPGSYTATASFAGDEPTYEPASASGGFALTTDQSQPPAAGDPTNTTPTAGDPTNTTPTAGDPTNTTPTAGDPTNTTPSAGDPTGTPPPAGDQAGTTH